jgi:hypothetical protein
MTDQDLFYLALQSVEGVGDIMAKKNLPIAVLPKLLKQNQQLAQLTE